MKAYICKKCKGEWGFFPSDYGYKKKDYPQYCPLGHMRWWEMFREVYETEGLKEALKMLFIRLKP